MKTYKEYLLPACFLTLFGCASNGDLNNVRNDVDQVKSRLFTVEKDLGGIRSESRSDLESMGKSVRADVTAIRKIAADIQASFDSAKADSAVINGKIDDIFISMKKTEDELARYRVDADQRILSLEDKLLKLSADLEEIKKKLASSSKTSQPDGTSQEDSLYLKGLDTFKNGDMPAARESFTSFLAQNPKHELAANAQYWIGETYYSEKSYELAIIAFQEVIKNYPGKEKVPAAIAQAGDVVQGDKGFEKRQVRAEKTDRKLP